MRVFAVILAGGQGRRMGGADKALLQLHGRPLITHVIGRLQPQAARLMISANGDAARFAFTGLDVLPDETAPGPLAGILAGLRAAQTGGADALVSNPVDAPFLPPDLVSRLLTAGPGPAFARAGGRDHNATAFWPVALADPLAEFLASGAKPKIADFAARHGAQPVDFPDAAAFDNLNTPEDLARAEARTA
ncbi:molybdenum cofactor guanylyltransferase MobA [Pseudogemmobacter bohemicus]|uniref:molybdenum cofactor guanylyltransferase MobA n=1 Tax=Pseudogemmobacter bohemicus TaxID=2250708 RepID=UPI000DD3CD0F|nr:molybdenum cofactor guanylyltransferase MobA [Pseudogemmobacter bohemicus]